MATQEKGDVALFIDWENIKWSLEDAEMSPNVSAIRDAAERYGRVVVAKAYADWSQRWHQEESSRLYRAGVEPVYVPTKASIRAQADDEGDFFIKGSVDVKMTADCIECAHSYPSVRTFVLVSGDADFVHVVNILRPYGKRVVAVGVSWSSATRLIQTVDEFLQYDKDVVPFAEAEPEPVQRTEVQQDKLDEAFQTVVDIVEGSRFPGRALASYVKLELIKRRGKFDESTYGFSQFRTFLKEAEKRGYIRLITDELVDWVYLPESVPEGEAEPSAAPPSDEEATNKLLRFADKLEKTYDYVAFKFLVDRAMGADLFDRLSRSQVSAVLNDAIEQRLFRRGTYVKIDPNTGEEQQIRTILLNRAHPRVQQALS
ncbi:MAG: NYN domain-containing protein [Chloroflexota bacterium]|nr:NYN domain-containing protein [Chloroflexota bacterium]